MKRKIIIFIVGALLFNFFTNSEAHAVLGSVTPPSYYNTVSEIPTNLSEVCPDSCTAYSDTGRAITDQCWNGSTPGVQISCGDACRTGSSGAGGTAPDKSWTWYYNLLTQSNRCRLNKLLTQNDPSGNNICTPVYIVNGASCSTADKYNIASYGGGDTTMLRAGSCSCGTQQLYKTCCSGANAVETYIADGNPNFPDGGCTATTTPCGSDPAIYSELGYTYPSSTNGVACGQPACQYFFGAPPPPPTTRYGCSNGQCIQDNVNGQFTESTCGQASGGPGCNPQCPNYPPPPTTTVGSCPAGTTCTAQQPSQTVQQNCSPTGSQCRPSCSFTCRDSVGNTCPATSCTTVWQCNTTSWYNGGQYYYTCPASCPACPVGATQTVCGTQQNQCRVP